jgi:hemerythrin
MNGRPLLFSGDNHMIEWNDKYSVNISLIDEQHKKLFEILNKAIIAKKHSKVTKDILGILDEMTEYALEHFEIEERYMKEFHFPEYQTHRKEHIDFANDTIDYKNRVVGGDFQILNEILDYLKQWLVNHIQVSDRKYIDCFQKNGLK